MKNKKKANGNGQQTVEDELRETQGRLTVMALIHSELQKRYDALKVQHTQMEKDIAEMLRAIESHRQLGSVLLKVVAHLLK